MEKVKERVEIGCYTKMSEMKGISSVKEYIDEAIKRDWKAIGITDLDSTQSFTEAQKYIENNEIKNLKLIYGVKTKFKDNNNAKEINDIIILVKEQKGLKNLYTLLSRAFTNEEEKVVYRRDLDKYREGLLYGTYGTDGELHKEIYYNPQSEELDVIANYYDFIQLEPLYNARKQIRKPHIVGVRIIDETLKLQEINRKMIDIGKKNNIIVIASSNPLFIKKEDSICNEILNHSQGIIDYKYNNERYMHTTEEMYKEFAYLEKEKADEIIVTNTNKLSNMCEKINVISSKISYPKIENSKEIIKEKCYKKVKEIYGDKIPKEIEERLNLELTSIIENEFEFIYLLASEIVKKSNELGYLVETRGSVGNSFVAFLLGIVDYNPIEYNLPFESFAGKNFDREPDIDLNISEKIRDKIHEYVIEKYGKDEVIYCGTVGTIADKTAEEMIEKYSKDLNYPIGENKKEKLVSKLVGIKKCVGVHPGGIIILPEDKQIEEITPIEHYKFNNKTIIKTHVDYHSILENGLYKCDILSSNTPTILHRLEEITKINPKDINLNDKETLAIFQNVGNEKYPISIEGISRFETESVKDILKKAKPKNLNDLVCIYSLSSGTGTWTSDTEGILKHISVDKVVSNRADIINFLISKGICRGIAFEITDFIRKGKASRENNSYWSEERKKKNSEQWERYKRIMAESNIPTWYIELCENIRYLFPKAHSIGYTIDAFRIAWYKVHYPEAFDNVKIETLI